MNLKNNKKKFIALSIFGIVILIGFIVGFFYIQYKKTHISTNDAFVEGSIYTISSKIAGTVSKVYVKSNQIVKKGEILVELEPDLYIQTFKKAEAILKVAQERILETEQMIEAQKRKIKIKEKALKKALLDKKLKEAIVNAKKADVIAKKAVLKQAEIELKRAENLLKEGVIPKDRYDKIKTSYETAKSAFIIAKELKKQAEINLQSHFNIIEQTKISLKAEKFLLKHLEATLKRNKQEVKRREAEAKLAYLKLSYTKIYSPTDGYVTKKSVEVGNQIQIGQPLMAIVPLNDVYIIANYKETKIHKIKQGMKVKIKVDAYPKKIFWGKVDSIMAGTGAAFSLFPPENATGNYVKVVQRIPVKIVLTKKIDKEYPLRIGMSVVPTILVNE